MNKILIKTYKLPDKSSVLTKNRKYRITLLNNITVYFSERSKIERFIILLNNDLNNILFELNNIYAGLFANYRFIIYVAGCSKYELKIITLTGQIERLFYRVVRCTSIENQVYNYFSFLLQLISCLQEFGGVLCAALKNKRYNNYTLQITASLRRLRELDFLLNNYGKKENNANNKIND